MFDTYTFRVSARFAVGTGGCSGAHGHHGGFANERGQGQESGHERCGCGGDSVCRRKSYTHTIVYRLVVINVASLYTQPAV